VATSDGLVEADLAIDGDRVVSIGPSSGSGEVVDCSGCLIGPGFVDIHVHFREPGQTWKEDIETGSRAAAAGGFTAVVPMANTDPATDRVGLAEAMIRRGRQVGLVEVTPAAALTVSRRGPRSARLRNCGTPAFGYSAMTATASVTKPCSRRPWSGSGGSAV